MGAWGQNVSCYFCDGCGKCKSGLFRPDLNECPSCGKAVLASEAKCPSCGRYLASSSLEAENTGSLLNGNGDNDERNEEKTR